MVILRSVSIYVICTFVARMAQQGIDFYLDKCYTFCLKRRNASSKQYKCVECQKLVSKSVGNVKVPLIRVCYGVYSDDPLNPANRMFVTNLVCMKFWQLSAIGRHVTKQNVVIGQEKHTWI